MNCQLDQVVRIIGAHVAKTRGLEASTVKAETKLFQEGMVDSFSLVELTGALEEGLGQPISEGSLIPEDFETPQTVYDRLQQV